MKIKDYKAAARRLLRGKYGILIASQFVQYMVSYTVLTVVMIIFGSAFAFFTTDNEVMKVVTAILLAVSIILAVLVSLFMTLGLNKQYLNMCRRGYVTFSDLFYAFRPGAHPMRYVWVSLCMGLMVGIPGLLLILLAVLGSELAFGSGSKIHLLSLYSLRASGSPGCSKPLQLPYCDFLCGKYQKQY